MHKTTKDSTFLVDPHTGVEWEGLKRGDLLEHSRVGPCEFYRHDARNKIVVVFDRYGIERKLPDQEILDGLRREAEDSEEGQRS